ncbi:hypothetical protein M1L60_03865 [Actinoplanes sp. TRM 88003]|uniref:Integral membrane protein n=1 Tax=Paractinoplanes aksuensis TaxID=2939490 RepID=A0ABT1DIU4_9ACTN|nr:hypothetical protein [Actinoplanes aksuensis]MCO8269726.1 hypothetical protein [Actinoplanes aksuensis]
MSDGEFLRYAGALAAAGLLFLILAVLGLGQGLILRVLDVLLGLAFLGYAGYLMVVAPDSPFMSWFVFATPALGLVVAGVARRRSRARMKRLEEDHSGQPYVAPAVTADRQPFPTPPPPLDPTAPAATKKKKSDGAKTGAMPSGLPPSGLGEKPVEAEPRPPRPSGLPQLGPDQPTGPASPAFPTGPTFHASPGGPATHGSSAGPAPFAPHSEPGYRARHGASGDETAEHDYARGRHRSDTD